MNHKSSGDHDGRYYTENEIDAKLSNKSNADHTHDDRYHTKSEIYFGGISQVIFYYNPDYNVYVLEFHSFNGGVKSIKIEANNTLTVI